MEYCVGDVEFQRDCAWRFGIEFFEAFPFLLLEMETVSSKLRAELISDILSAF